MHARILHSAGFARQIGFMDGIQGQQEQDGTRVKCTVLKGQLSCMYLVRTQTIIVNTCKYSNLDGS